MVAGAGAGAGADASLPVAVSVGGASPSSLCLRRRVCVSQSLGLRERDGEKKWGGLSSVSDTSPIPVYLGKPV